MVALANNTTSLNIASPEGQGPRRVAAGAEIFRCALLQEDTLGNVSPTPASSPSPFAGIADDYADNTSGAAGAISVDVVKEGTIKQISVAGSGASAIGDAVYAASDNPADLTITATGNQQIGWLEGNQAAAASTIWDVRFQSRGRRD